MQLTLDSDTALDSPVAELYLTGPGGRFPFSLISSRREDGGKRWRLIFSEALDLRTGDLDLPGRFRQVDTLRIRLTPETGETVRLTEISVSSYHRKALVYF